MYRRGLGGCGGLRLCRLHYRGVENHPDASTGHRLCTHRRRRPVRGAVCERGVRAAPLAPGLDFDVMMSTASRRAFFTRRRRRRGCRRAKSFRMRSDKRDFLGRCRLAANCVRRPSSARLRLATAASATGGPINDDRT